jgi:hypothetical protein
VWPILKHSPDPRVRSYLLHWLAPRGAESAAVVKRLDEEADLSSRRALLLSLGEYGDQGMPAEARKALLPTLKVTYQRDADAGVHAAAEWLLRRWKEEPWLKQVNTDWAKDRERREQRLEQVKKKVADLAAPPGLPATYHPPRALWFVNSQEQTLVAIPGPATFLMGSPVTEADRSQDNELRHPKRIARPRCHRRG